MKSYFLLSVCAASLLFASCSKSNNDVSPAISQEGINTVSKNSGQPFKGSMKFVAAENYDMPCDCGPYFPAGTYYGTGSITHLGNASAYMKPCVAPIFQGNALVGYNVAFQCGALKAANGDELNVFIHPYTLTFTNTGAVGNVNIDFTGGTGRFKNATGSFKAGTSNDGMGNVTLDNINGTINY